MVVVPDVRIPAKTASLYARLSSDDFSDGSRIAAQAARLRSGLVPDATLLGNAFARPFTPWSPSSPPCRTSCVTPAPHRSPFRKRVQRYHAVVINAAQAERVAARLRERLGDRAQVIVARPAPARP